MIALDANLLLYAHISSYPQHEAARDWLELQLVGGPRVAVPWSSALAFVRIATNPRIFSEPASLTEAWRQVEDWLDADPVWVPSVTARHRRILGDCLGISGLQANDVPDAHLAALAIEHGLRLASVDSGFARFPGLEWFNPLPSRA